MVTIKVEVQGYKVELQGAKITIEGTSGDAAEVVQQVEKQLAGMLQPPALLKPTALSPGNRAPVLDAQVLNTENDKRQKRPARKGGGGSKTSADEITISIDPSKHGSPMQGWTPVQKAVWFLHIVETTTSTRQLTAYAIAKNFNRHFKAAGSLDAGNLSRALEKERLKGTDAILGADTNDGSAKYYLTQAGTASAQQLIKGETPTAA
jgi:hypothetical protein